MWRIYIAHSEAVSYDAKHPLDSREAGITFYIQRTPVGRYLLEEMNGWAPSPDGTKDAGVRLTNDEKTGAETFAASTLIERPCGSWVYVLAVEGGFGGVINDSERRIGSVMVGVLLEATGSEVGGGEWPRG